MNFDIPKTPDSAEPRLEAIAKLEAVFSQTENENESGDRESAKESLKLVYSGLLDLNKSSDFDWRVKWEWNPEGDLTKDEFETLLLRRKRLDNAIGILTSSGVIRHDVCKDIL